MLFQHRMSIAQQLIPIYNTNVPKNKINVALNEVYCWMLWDTQQATRAVRGPIDFVYLSIQKSIIYTLIFSLKRENNTFF